MNIWDPSSRVTISSRVEPIAGLADQPFGSPAIGGDLGPVALRSQAFAWPCLYRGSAQITPSASRTVTTRPGRPSPGPNTPALPPFQGKTPGTATQRRGKGLGPPGPEAGRFLGVLP